MASDSHFMRFGMPPAPTGRSERPPATPQLKRNQDRSARLVAPIGPGPAPPPSQIPDDGDPPPAPPSCSCDFGCQHVPVLYDIVRRGRMPRIVFHHDMVQLLYRTAEER
jgi:hypothetical protein